MRAIYRRADKFIRSTRKRSSSSVEHPFLEALRSTRHVPRDESRPLCACTQSLARADSSPLFFSFSSSALLARSNGEDSPTTVHMRSPTRTIRRTVSYLPSFFFLIHVRGTSSDIPLIFLAKNLICKMKKLSRQTRSEVAIDRQSTRKHCMRYRCEIRDRNWRLSHGIDFYIHPIYR